jgi:hypothetical protein
MMSSFKSPQSTAVRSSLLVALAKTRLLRYRRSGDEREIDTLTLHFTLAIFLPSSRPCNDGLNPVSALFFLSEALLHRALKSEQLSDVRYCIKCIHFLRRPGGQSLVAFGLYHDLAKHLLFALALQLKIEPPNEMHLQVVEEMSVLCSELLALDLADEDLIDPVANFARGVHIYLQTLGNEPSQQVIESLREANNRISSLYDISCTFTYSLVIRFGASKSNDDFEDAMATVNTFLSSHSTTDGPIQLMKGASGLAAMLAYGRFAYYRKPEDLEETLSKLPPDTPEHLSVFGFLENLEGTCFREYGVANGNQEVHARDPKSCRYSLICMRSWSRPSYYHSIPGKIRETKRQGLCHKGHPSGSERFRC